MNRIAVSLLFALVLASACEPMRSSGRQTDEAAAPEAQKAVDEPDPPEREEPAPTLPEAQRADAPYSAPHAPSVEDHGVFSDLDAKVRVTFPSWLEDEPVTVAAHPGLEHRLAYVDGVPVGFATPDMGKLKVVANPEANDADEDGIPDQLDILLGAKKTAINAAPYQGGYQGLEYPGGDVPRGEGVCTDVIIRAVRNAGIDLQKELHEDIERAGSAYPMVKKPDTNIDQRRVKTLLPYFERQWDARNTDLDPKTDWLPGDIVFMNTMRDERPDHLGIVSDELGDSGYPLIINNWTNGYHTQPMDLLKFVPVTHRFRLPADEVDLEEPGVLERKLARHGLELAPEHGQAILVTAETDGAPASLRRFERGATQHWRAVGDPVEARVGRAGLGLGRGLERPKRTGLTPKVEGDGKATAGVFALGTAFGAGPKSYDGAWPWRTAGPEARWVDDPDSPHYNTWQSAGGDWDSAEQLANYDLALVVEHNTTDTEPGAGSAIFVHDWSLDSGGTLGCTGIARDDMLELLAWLDPEEEPVLVQLPR